MQQHAAGTEMQGMKKAAELQKEDENRRAEEEEQEGGCQDRAELSMSLGVSMMWLLLSFTGKLTPRVQDLQ